MCFVRRGNRLDEKAALGERPIASQEEGGEEKEGDAATEEGSRPKKRK